MVNLESTGTVTFQAASPSNPDILAVQSKDKNGAAANVTVIAPLPVVGTRALLQIVRQADPNTAYQFWHTVAAGDTPLTVAQALAAQITANTTLQALGIAGQYVIGSALFGVSHWFNDTITVGAAAWNPDGSQVMHDNGGFFTIGQAGSRLDAGPIFALAKFPAGWGGEAGSNVGQIPFEGPTTQNPGVIAAQYATVCGNIKNPDAANLAGEYEIDTAQSVNGQPTIRKRLGVTKGLYMSVGGNDLADMGEGTIHCTELWVNGVRIA